MKIKKLFSIFLLFLFLYALIYYCYPENKLPNNIKASKIIVFKSKYEMHLFANNQLIKIYTISLGANPIGHKKNEGDERTPEGIYLLDYKNSHSKAYLSIHISYPNKLDRQYASNSNKNPGGNIMIHGLPNAYSYIGKFHRFYNWTDGCIGITNEEMDEIWNAVELGTIIEIKP